MASGGFRLFGYLSEIDDIWRFSLNNIEDRKKLQKFVYLLQALGCRLHYHYNLYIHGPYSPELTREAYNLNLIQNPIREILSRRVKVDDLELGKIRKLKELVKGLDRSEDLEILATIHYLKHVAYMPDRSKEAIFKELLEKKPHLGSRVERTGFNTYWKRLSEFDLV